MSAQQAYLGRVDAKTPDSSIVWVVSVAGLGRRMYGNRDGVRLRPESDDAVGAVAAGDDGVGAGFADYFTIYP
ncbi:hypothetical protein [Arthrobacter sp. PM3]|uniref:hypothetical protein n=1 Tax=Arthrobacter sp. PM3 TaxID=2017685 RepID=UPI001ABF86E0|nr:hypothetical protein [Arthrobacter sp. PM3]